MEVQLPPLVAAKAGIQASFTCVSRWVPASAGTSGDRSAWRRSDFDRLGVGRSGTGVDDDASLIDLLERRDLAVDLHAVFVAWLHATELRPRHDHAGEERPRIGVVDADLERLVGEDEI